MVKKIETEEPSAPLWMVSYGDLVTNMLCCFVMLFSFMAMDADISESIRDQDQWQSTISVHKNTGEHKFVGSGGDGVLGAARKREEAPRIARDIREKLGATLLGKLKVSTDDLSVKIEIPDDLLFVSGGAVLRKEAEEVLTALLPVISSIDNYVRVDGHTDSVPITSAKATFPSNWELSAARACAVVRFYVETLKQSPSRFSAQGYGQYKPLATNDTEEGKKTNRRVDLRIMLGGTSKKAKTWSADD